MGGSQTLPPTIFIVLMIPSVPILNANKKIMLPALIAISTGFPAAVNSTVEKLLTRCLMISGTLRSVAHTGVMSQKLLQIQKYIMLMLASITFGWHHYRVGIFNSAATQ